VIDQANDQVRRRCAALNVIVAGHSGGNDADALMQMRILCHSLRGLLKDEISLERVATIEAHAGMYLSGEQEGPFLRRLIAKELALLDVRRRRAA
jgi:hypothetical protein